VEKRRKHESRVFAESLDGRLLGWIKKGSEWNKRTCTSLEERLGKNA
jgi:hypothetical protein